MNTIVSVSTVTLEEVRPWVGRRLILKRSLENFSAGTQCIVMCSVDFGEGPLLWVKAEDEALTDVGQFELAMVREIFDVAPDGLDERGRAAAQASIRAMPAHGEDGENSARPFSLGRRLAEAVAGALRRVAGFGREFARSVAAAREAARLIDRYWHLSDRELAARGLTRSDVSNLIRDRLIRSG